MKSISLLIFISLTTPILVEAQANVIDSLQKVAALGKNDESQLRTLNKLTGEFLRKDVTQAFKYQWQGLHLAKALKQTTLLSSGYSQMITLHSSSGNADSAEYYIGLLKQLAFASNNDTIMANYCSIVGLELKKAGDFKNSLPYLIKAEKIAAKFKNKVSQAGQCINIGNVYSGLGEYQKSLHFHLKALRLFEAEGNKQGLSFCYGNIGNLLLKLKQYESARTYFVKSMQLKKQLDDKRGTGTSLWGLAFVYSGLKDYDKALRFAFDAMGVSKELKLTTYESVGYLDIARIYTKKEDFKKAEEFFRASKESAIQTGDSSIFKMADAELVSLQNNNAKEQQAEEKLISNLHYSLDKGHKSHELAAYQHLSEYYAGKKQFEKALEYNKRYHEVNNAIQSADVQLQIKELEAQYNMEKKEQEIALLKKDRQLQQLNLQKQKTFQYGALVFLILLVLIGFLIINRYRVVQRAKRLVEMEKLRNNISRDLHDDIGSTLTSINILSKVTLQQTDGNLMVRSNLQKIKEHSSTIMESMSDIVWAINPQNDTLEKIIFRMKEFAAEILDPLNIEYTFIEEGDFSGVRLDVNKRKDLYLVFKEAVNNAAKYSNCKNVKVVLQHKAQNMHLEVTDDGKGFDEQQVKKGNGLRNIQERAKAMFASLQFNSSAGMGTTIQLSIPIT